MIGIYFISKYSKLTFFKINNKLTKNRMNQLLQKERN